MSPEEAAREAANTISYSNSRQGNEKLTGNANSSNHNNNSFYNAAGLFRNQTSRCQCMA